MANSGDRNLHGGDQSEYLAQYMLSFLGAAAFVPRQEDIGIDFHCSLYEDIDARHRTYHSPFTLQLGSLTNDEVTKDFTYGGCTKPKKEENKKHKEWEIRFLRQQQLPFFVGTVDKAKLQLRIYSTAALWFVLYRRDPIGEIELCPDAMHDPIRESQDGTIDTPAGPMPRFRVPLGKPIVDVVVTDIGTEKYKGAAAALAKMIEWEQKNLLYRNLGVRTSWRALDYEPNKPLQSLNYNFVPHPEVFSKGRDLLRAAIINLAMAYHQASQQHPEDQVLKQHHAKVRGFLETLDLSPIDLDILREEAGIDIHPPATAVSATTPPVPGGA